MADILSGVLSGAAAGAATGNVVGAVIGAGIGGALAIRQGNEEEALVKKAEEDKRNALRRAAFLETLQRRQADSLGGGRNLSAQSSKDSNVVSTEGQGSAISEGISSSSGTF